MKNAAHIAISALLITGATAIADEKHTHAAPNTFNASRVAATPFGMQGDPAMVNRTIRVSMNDRMRFEPASVNVRRGDTVRLVLVNEGAVLHEMVLGTVQTLKEHRETMKKHPGMSHDEPGAAHVKPGATGEIVWRFTQAGEFQFACLLPGHFEAGMVGKVIVT
jgi:uncharacterized cupredoxin-like copper-binding protein